MRLHDHIAGPRGSAKIYLMMADECSHAFKVVVETNDGQRHTAKFHMWLSAIGYSRDMTGLNEGR